MITIIASFEVLPEKSSEFIKCAVDLTRETRRERGNLSYKVLKAQNGSGFTFVEEWLNEAAIEMHNKSPHFIKFIEEIKPIIKGDASIERFTRIPSVFY